MLAPISAQIIPAPVLLAFPLLLLLLHKPFICCFLKRGVVAFVGSVGLALVLFVLATPVVLFLWRSRRAALGKRLCLFWCRFVFQFVIGFVDYLKEVRGVCIFIRMVL